MTLPTVKMRKLSTEIVNTMPKVVKLVRVESGSRTSRANHAIHALITQHLWS